MTRDEAEEILHKAYALEEISCNCHICPPCGKCENMPSEDLIAEAEERLNNE